MISKPPSTPLEIYKELKDFVTEEARSSRTSHENLLRKPVRNLWSR